MSSNQEGFDNLAYKKDSQVEITRNNTSSKNDGKDGKQKSRVKCLKFFLTIFFLATVGLIIAVVILAKKDDSEKDDMKTTTQLAPPEKCLTTDCIASDFLRYIPQTLAARIAESIDTSVNPCDDFYTFTCGRWKLKNIIPDDKSSENAFSLLQEDVTIFNKYLLEDDDLYNNIEAIKKAKDMYSACLDIALIEKKNESVAVPLLEELGGWPMLGSNPGGNWNKSEFNLVQFLVTLRKYSNAPMILMYVNVDKKDSENRIIYMDQPGFGLPGRLYYLLPNLEHMRDAYVKLASSVAVLFGAEQTTAEQAMREVLELETELANITAPSELRRDQEALYKKMTISELAQDFTKPSPSDNIQFNWFEYINGIMDMDGVKVEINESEPVVVYGVPYFQSLFAILQKYDKRVIANYLVWYIMQSRANNLDSRFKDLLTKYNEIVFGTKSFPSRWKTCLYYVVNQMSFAVGHMFVKETFDESAKSAALEMIGSIREAFSELLEDVGWMDEETRTSARDKMEAMESWIGYPDDTVEPEYINTYYENVTVNRDDYFGNVLNDLKRASSDRLRVLREKIDKNQWPNSIPPTTINAGYVQTLNNIVFPAGILQPPFYSKYQPKAMNYGAIGMVIGHEITHGFDDSGRRFDKDGNLKQWWNDESVDNFKEKVQCMVDQYGKYVVPKVNLTINGINTLGENIADNGGLKQSFRAYRRWVEKRGSEEPTLPGLNYNSNQLFFISFAQIWCINSRKEFLIQAINNGVHSPGQFRVIGTLQNSKDFSDAFGCSNNDKMNPPDKCSVW